MHPIRFLHRWLSSFLATERRIKRMRRAAARGEILLAVTIRHPLASDIIAGRLLSVRLHVPGPRRPRRVVVYAGYPSSHYPGLDLRDCPIGALIGTVHA